MRGSVTERTLYPVLMQIIRERGGTSVSEVRYNSEPDIVFDFEDRKWIMSVKIGETTPILKQAFIQYQRHKEESKIDHGVILFFPDAVRLVETSESAVLQALRESKCSCLIDTPEVKEQLTSVAFPHILLQIEQEVVPRLKRKEEKAYPLDTVISLLQLHVSELMQSIKLTDREMLGIVTDRRLLSGIGHLDEKGTAETSSFLAAYIVLSQILFLRLFSRTRPDILPSKKGKVTHEWLRSAFRKVRDINYRPIYNLDVLDAVPESYVQDTFDLIWGLEVERVRHELPGRIFHELMPKGIRKMLAAFYTRPQAADLLARLTVKHSNDMVYDPACGSGTILVSAYRRKQELFNEEGHSGNPHKRFCEKDIYGSDIMPFAVHLSGANLASMDPATTIEKTQIIQGDSLKLTEGIPYKNGVQTTLFPTVGKGYTMKGGTHDVVLGNVDIVLMNPPFTKVERGIRNYVDMERFGGVCGNEVGLWGHFIALADVYLVKNGLFGGVIPINLLRGRESEKIREFIFSKWTPLYVLKSTFNYGFSEWAEYRDVLFIARKGKSPENHVVKFVLVKKNLKELTKSDVSHIVNQVELKRSLRSDDLDIESFSVEELRERFTNLMWFCGVSKLKNRDILISFKDKFSDCLTQTPKDYFVEGYRPVPKGVSSFMFLTRSLEDSRVEEAFLSFDREDLKSINAKSMMGVRYVVERSALSPSLRTGIGISTFDLTGKLDFVANTPYKELDNVVKASKFKKPKEFDWKRYWENIDKELVRVRTRLVAVHRVNPYSPSTYLFSFFSEKPFSPSNVLNVVDESDADVAKTVCVLLNSALFLSQFFLIKEETTGRYINLRFYDFYEMEIFPKKEKVKELVKVFHEFSNRRFPSLREQLDRNFDERYESFWLATRKGQKGAFDLREQVDPSKVRLEFDLSVCRALGVPVSREELLTLYGAIVEEMIMTRGLTRD
nr:N-6 DNA methylase [Candidatus Njordarchaeota archaeon]